MACSGTCPAPIRPPIVRGAGGTHNAIDMSDMPAIPRANNQTDIARAFMTPETKDVLPPRVLDARIGDGTVAGGLNDSLRFRVRGSGDERTIVPDSKLAVDLMKTRAGGKLVQQLEVAASSADWTDKSNLKGFVLPRDTQAVAAAEILSYLDPGGPPPAMAAIPIPPTQAGLKALMHDTYAESSWDSRSAGAWNQLGWITFMPDTARAMLTSVGAYHPDRLHRSEKALREASFAPYIAGTATHEVQHSITPRKGRYEDVRWMEEGIANIFSKTATFLRDEMQRMGVSAQSYAGHLAHPPEVDLGWGPWKRKELPAKEEKEVHRVQKMRYRDSQPILRGLLRMAGAPLNSNVGKDTARELLQGSELNRVAGNLAAAMIERNGADRSIYEPLRQRIIHSIEDPHSLTKIARDFGLAGP